jgi:hypothetical protein
MAQILNRLLNDHVVEILRARADCRGVPLEQSVRALLTPAAVVGMEQRQHLAALRCQAPPAGRGLDMSELIRHGRDERCRALLGGGSLRGLPQGCFGPPSAGANGQLSLYDCLYLTLAERRQGVLPTQDGRLLQKVEGISEARGCVMELEGWGGKH